jgi:succinate-acetate transporter protein
MKERAAPLKQSEHQDKLQSMTRIVLRPLASPLPLAFFAFGAGSALLSCQQLGLIPPPETKQLAIVFGAFVFPLQFVTALFAFLSRETLGATALGLISFSWLATALVLYTFPPNETSATLGFLSLILAVILLLLGAVGLLGKPLLSGIILIAVARFSLNGLYDLTAISAFQTVSAVIGLVIFGASLYGGLALSLEDVQHRTVLPFGRRGEAREAIEGDLNAQIGPIEQEAGVRKQL